MKERGAEAIRKGAGGDLIKEGDIEGTKHD